MALISQNFLNDTQGNANSTIPIILLADLPEFETDFVILDSFSTKNLNVYKKTSTSSNLIQPKPILKNISSIKNALDVERRKLKTNTFRFSIYNYYDVTKPLTNSEKYTQIEGDNPLISLIGKYVLLYYKSQTTELLDISKNSTYFTPSENFCPLLFIGMISRVTMNNDIITFQGEDSTQDALKDNTLPSTKVSDLPSLIKNNIILEEDKDKYVPMVFGKVGKSPAITYKTNNVTQTGNVSLSFLHDRTTIGNKFMTAKMPQDFNLNHHLYIKDSSDYLIFPYYTEYKKDLGITELLGEEEGSYPIVPEYSDSYTKSSIYCFGYSYCTNAISNLTQTDLSSLDGNISEDESINPDFSALTYNDREKFWFWNNTDAQENLLSDDESFDFGHQVYDTSTGAGKGRWILLKFDKEEVIFSFCCYSKLYVSPDDNSVTNDDDHRLFFKPFFPEQVSAIIDNAPFIDFWGPYLNNDTTLGFNVGIFDSNDYIYFDQTGFGLQELPENSSQDIVNKIVFEGYNNNTYLQNIDTQLIPFSSSFATSVKEVFEDSAPTDRLLVYEFYNVEADSTIQCGGYMNSFVAKYMKEIEDYPSAKYYASITGRKDYTSTEKLELAEIYEELGAYNYALTLLGDDEQEPDYVGVLDTWDEYFRKKYIMEPSNQYVEEYGDLEAQGFLTRDSWYSSNWEIFGIISSVTDMYGMGTQGSEFEIPDFRELGLDDSLFMTSGQITSFVIHSIMRKFYSAIAIRATLDTILDPDADWANIIDGWEETMPDGWGIVFDYINGNGVRAIGLLPKRFFDLMKTQGLGTPSSWISVPEVEIGTMIQTRIDEYRSHGRSLLKHILRVIYQNEISIEDGIDDIFQIGGAEAFSYEYNPADIYNEDGTINVESYVDYFNLYLDDICFKSIKSVAHNIMAQPDIYVTGDYQPLESHFFYAWFKWFEDYHTGNEGIYQAPINIYNNVDFDSILVECFNYTGSIFETDGLVHKPIDIIINILSRELSYGINDRELPSSDYYNKDKIQEARDYYNGWKMGFCIDKEIEADKLISDICKETQSFFNFQSDGSIDLITIKNKYVYDDIQHFIDENDIISYKFEKTKRENVISSCKYYYRYDNGFNNYTENTGLLYASELLQGYDGDNYYNLLEGIGYKEKNLRYHTDKLTTMTYTVFDLLNNCNQHNLVTLNLPLKYLNIEMGDILYLPLIKNQKIFGIDYSIVSTLNGQAIYPVWLVTEVDIKLDRVIIKAYQLHHLTTDAANGFLFPDEIEQDVLPEVEVNLKQHHSFYNVSGNPLENWNYYTGPFDENYNYVHNDDLQIPYGDYTGEGVLNVVDIVGMINIILGVGLPAPTLSQIERADINKDGNVDVVDIVALISVILYSVDYNV